VSAQRVDVGLTLSADGGRDHGAISTRHETELEDDERHGDGVVGVAGVEELPAASDSGPALCKDSKSILAPSLFHTNQESSQSFAPRTLSSVTRA